MMNIWNNLDLISLNSIDNSYYNDSRNCVLENTSLREEIPSQSEKNAQTEANHSEIVRVDNAEAKMKEEASLGALFYEFSGVLAKLPKASPYIKDMNIPTIRLDISQ